MVLRMNFENDECGFASSAVVWAAIALFSIISLREQHVRKRYIQRDIIFLLTCNVILRLFWFLRQEYNSNFATRFVNRVAILVQLTGLVLLFQTWFKSISDNPSMSRKFKYFCCGAIVFAWTFILTTIFQCKCHECDCVWYTVNIVFIGCISLAMALGVLIYGIMVRKRLMDVSNENLMDSTAYNARLKHAHQLFRVCGVIVVLFTIRALLFIMGEFVNLVGYDLYPWWFYQVFIK
jgi:uncharacterized membrane protein